MKTVYIGFSTSKKWNLWSAIIRFYEKTPYSHVYIRFPWVAGGIDLIYQASGLAVNFTSPDLFNENNKIIKEYKLEVSDEAMTETLAWAAKNAGKPYSLKQILGIIIFNIRKKICKNPRNPFPNGDRAYICSELVARLLISCFGTQIDADLDTFTPKDLDSLLSNPNIYITNGR